MCRSRVLPLLLCRAGDLRKVKLPELLPATTLRSANQLCIWHLVVAADPGGRAYYCSMNENDIWRAAELIIDNHGDRAEFVAYGRIHDMIANGDPAGELVWTQILAAVKQL